jgi:hypothetical protein
MTIATTWKYTNADQTVVYRILDDGSTESCLVTRVDVQEWIANGNTPAPADV